MNIIPKILIILALSAVFAGIDVYRRPPQLTVKTQTTPPVTTPVTPVTPPVTIPQVTPPVFTPNTQTPPIVAPSPQPAQLELEITTAQAKALFDEGTTFLDARLAHEYKAEHIRFALHLDSNELGSPEAAAVLAKLTRTQRLVIYCGGGDCHASHNLAIFLQQAGYTSLHIFKDGFPAWKSAGYELSTGENP